MKKFHFSLDPLLEQRRHSENQCAVTAASALTELKNAETQLWELKDAEATISLAILRSAGDFQILAGIQSRITQTEAVISDLREAVTIAQTELQAATRECKIMEHLRDRRRKSHREIQIRAEQRDIEESNQCRPSGSTTFSPLSS